MAAIISHWFPQLRDGGDADVRLFCFPYAGASAFAFSRWSQRLPDNVDLRPLQLPGRGRRIAEPALSRMEELIEVVGSDLLRLVDRSYAFFGHSMGALLAFELVRWLRRRGVPEPLHLYVSGRRAPHMVGPSYISPDAPDETFVAYLRTLDGTPPEILDDPELMALLLPAVRADLCICRSYSYVAELPIGCPITAFGGRDDPESLDARLRSWTVHTTERFAARTFAGGHFYLHPQEPALLSAISGSLLQNARASLTPRS